MIFEQQKFKKFPENFFFQKKFEKTNKIWKKI